MIVDRVGFPTSGMAGLNHMIGKVALNIQSRLHFLKINVEVSGSLFLESNRLFLSKRLDFQLS